MLYDGVWGTVCDDYWETNDAKVVCRQLGLPTASATAYSNAFYGQNLNLRINMDNVGCTGAEATLQSCAHVGPASHDCTHVEDAAVACPSAPPATTVRLVNGGSNSRGRVEAFVGGRWGTVCDDNFGNEEARVICRQLGQPWTTATAVGYAYFGANTALPIVMDELRCTGTESFLQSCVYDTLHDCYHSEDAGVICTGSMTADTTSIASNLKDEPLPRNTDNFSTKPSNNGNSGNNGNNGNNGQGGTHGNGNGKKLQL